MKYKEVKRRVKRSIADWSSIDCEEDRTPEKYQKHKFYRKYVTCGKLMCNLKTSIKLFQKKCSSPACPECSRKWSVNQGIKLMKCHPLAERDDYVFITFMIDITKDVEKIYSIHTDWREKIKTDARNKRRLKGPTGLLWKAVAWASSLEIDCFRENQYHLLGAEKREQLEQKLGYVPNPNSSETVWVVHNHMIFHRGSNNRRLDDVVLADFAAKHSKTYHIAELDTEKTKADNIYACMRYGAKINFWRRTDNAKTLYWDKDQIREYVSVVYKTKGRSEYINFMGSEGSREIKRQQKERKKQRLELEKVLRLVKDVQKKTIHTNSVRSDLEIFEDVWEKLIERFDAGEVEIGKGKNICEPLYLK